MQQHIALKTPNRSRVIKELEAIIAEWRAWKEEVDKLGSDPETPYPRLGQIHLDGEENIKKHHLLQEKTLAFLEKNIEGHGFIHGKDGAKIDRDDLRLNIRVQHRIDDLDELRVRIEYAEVPARPNHPNGRRETEASMTVAMTDAERRMVMLRRFHAGRNDNTRGLVKIQPEPSIPREKQLIEFNICRHLHEEGLIVWKGSSRGTYDGVGWITERGIKTIEAANHPDTSLPAAPFVIQGDVYFGDRNSQKIRAIGKVEAPMGRSTITKPPSRSFIGKLFAAVKSFFTGS